MLGRCWLMLRREWQRNRRRRSGSPSRRNKPMEETTSPVMVNWLFVLLAGVVCGFAVIGTAVGLLVFLLTRKQRGPKQTWEPPLDLEYASTRKGPGGEQGI